MSCGRCSSGRTAAGPPCGYLTSSELAGAGVRPGSRRPSTRSIPAWPSACRRRWALPARAIVFERPSRGRTRIDLWVREPYDLAVEVKYLRSHASGSQPARPPGWTR
jgi:hypothetical protein